MPSSVNRSLPREADTIVTKALAKSLDQRYESAATLAAELRSLAAILDVRSDSSEAAASVPMSAASPGRSMSGWIALLIVVAALAAAAWFERAAIQRVWRRTLGPAPAPVMVVIPLELAAPDVSQTFFADGLIEDLITRLGQTPGLTIVGRSAMRSDRGRSPRDLARELNATVVLTGSARPAAEAVNVSLELIDPSDSTTIWSSQYARDLNDVFAVQAQVAEDVALALRLKLQPTASSARTAARLVDAGAYTSYLHGRQAAAERQVPEAIGQFRSAIAADGGLAEAFAGLAGALQLEMQADSQLDDRTHRDAVKEAASRAHEIDPDLPEANLAMGVAADALPQALASMRRAVELDPSYSEAYRTIGDQILDIDPDRAMAFYRKSLALDPRLDINHASIAAANLALDRTDAALQELDTLHAGSTAGGWGQGLRVVTDVENHRLEQALATMRRLPSLKTIPPFWLTYVIALRMAGFRPDATQEASQQELRPLDRESVSDV
jgi:TolB-like protein